MTDKQIIIDGVDVRGCSCHYNGWSQLYRDSRDMCDKGCDLECKPKENGCYHYTKCLEEQLQAKQQECERWKSNFNGKVSAIEELLKQLDQLKAENEELKNNDVFSIRHFKDKYDVLKQTLVKIKEIGETCSFTDNSELLLSRIEHILQKISEREV